MDVIAKLGMVLGLSFISGINLYATVAVVGFCSKYHLIEGLPPEFSVLGHDAVIFVAVLLYILEFLVDKIPGLDSLWDLLHTLIRPLGGAMLALIQVGEASPALEVIAFMVGASMASAAHFSKAGVRLIINTSPEPFSNVLVSLAEDVGAFGLAYLSLAHPRVSLVVTVLLLGLLAFLMPMILRTVRMLFSAIFYKVKCYLWKEAAWTMARSVPFQLDAYFEQQREPDEKLLWTGPAFAVRLPGARRSTALQVMITTKAILILHRHWFRRQSLRLPLEDLESHKTYPGLLLNKWLLRTVRGDWVFQVYQPLAKTLPQDLKGEVDTSDRALFTAADDGFTKAPGV
ncbi:MAG: DUF4126 domain-containing protein [Syntrophobacteraceae bacterium]